MGNNVTEGTVVDEVVEQTLNWADAMKDWLLRYNVHVEQLCTEKEIPKPPPW